VAQGDRAAVRVDARVVVAKPVIAVCMFVYWPMVGIWK
jgi:hypothetical protein